MNAFLVELYLMDFIAQEGKKTIVRIHKNIWFSDLYEI